jgi:hypothetical protein
VELAYKKYPLCVNGHGTATIIRAINYGLLGKIERDANLLLNCKENDGDVTIQFEMDGAKYKIIRTITRHDDKTAIETTKAYKENVAITQDEMVELQKKLMPYHMNSIGRDNFTNEFEYFDFIGKTEEMRLYVLRRIFGSNLERVFEEIKTETKTMLSFLLNKPLTIDIEDDRLVMSYNEPKYDVSSCSRQEKCMINACFAFALCYVKRATDFMVIHRVFDCLDNKNQEKLPKLFEYLENKFNMLLVTSHFGNIRAKCQEITEL